MVTGIRVSAFVSGGVIPVHARGTKLEAVTHLADWYATFCELAGVDPTDAVAAAHGLPPIDSESLWPLLQGEKATTSRQTLTAAVDYKFIVNISESSAVLVGDRWKYIHGFLLLSYWQGPEFPNASSSPYGEILDPRLWHFCEPCLFDMLQDPGEHHNVAVQHLDIVRIAEDALQDARATQFQPRSDKNEAECQDAVKRYGNFYGPWHS